AGGGGGREGAYGAVVAGQKKVRGATRPPPSPARGWTSQSSTVPPASRSRSRSTSGANRPPASPSAITAAPWAACFTHAPGSAASRSTGPNRPRSDVTSAASSGSSSSSRPDTTTRSTGLTARSPATARSSDSRNQSRPAPALGASRTPPANTSPLASGPSQ